MTKTRAQIFAVFVLLAGVGAAAGAAQSRRDAGDDALESVKGYRQWARVTESPMPVEFPSAAG